MNYLLDTNHWIQWQRRAPPLLRRLGEISAGSNIFMPVVAQAELLVGIQNTPGGKRRDRMRALYDESIATAEILPITPRVAESFATLSVQLRADGKPIPTNDIGIAAIAVTADLTMASTDAHMRYIRGLRVEDWTASAA